MLRQGLTFSLPDALIHSEMQKVKTYKDFFYFGHQPRHRVLTVAHATRGNEYGINVLEDISGMVCCT